jgi:ectoine hydroxylase-related dioxygenase (phytanoyl-CoA dioxygenase family)
MTGLSQDEAAAYRRDGYVFPVEVMAEDDAVALRKQIETVERRVKTEQGVSHQRFRSFCHLLMPSIDRLVREPAILDPVDSILGPDLMVWSAEFFIKDAHTPNHVSWHQDLTYWGLDSTDEVTAWVALSDVTVESGCMRFVPGSHKREIVAHRDTFADDNMLTRGQEIAVAFDDSVAVDIVLKPGQMSLHHGRMFHASGPNRSDARRFGLAVRYIAPSMRQAVGERDFAVLVRGEDRYGHFVTLPAPTGDFMPEALEMCTEIDREQAAYFYRGTEPRYK